MIYDAFIFFNENDVLDIRFQELYDVVDKFVIVTSNRTFRGNPKPDYFDYERFEPYMDKVVISEYTYANDAPYDTTWSREQRQRDHIKAAVRSLKPRTKDTVLISDADEIPRRSVIENLEYNDVVALRMDHYVGWLNMWGEHNACPKAVRWWKLTTPQRVRKMLTNHVIHNAGWEFSSLGDAEHVSQKLKAFAHHEFDYDNNVSPEVVAQRLKDGTDIVGRGWRHIPKAIDDTWPEAVKSNREYWSKYEWQI